MKIRVWVWLVRNPLGVKKDRAPCRVRYLSLVSVLQTHLVLGRPLDSLVCPAK